MRDEINSVFNQTQGKGYMDPLGDRMKVYEKVEAGRRFMPLLPVMARIDGRSFSKFTSTLPRPYCEDLSKVMIEVTKWLVQQTNANLGYTQSDEITLCWLRPNYDSEVFFGGKVQKMVSILAAMATAKFNSLIADWPEAKKMPVFDCRVWNVPTIMEAANVFQWRELDATKNSVSMAARHYYSHNQLDGKTCGEMHEMLFQKGVNWNDYPVFFKRGTYVQRLKINKPFTVEELEALPPKHNARANPDLVVERIVYRILDLPPLSRVVNKVSSLFFGSDPQLKSDELLGE